MNKKSWLILFMVFFAKAVDVHAQVETGVPFMTIPTSAQGNGMGGIAASLITDDAISNIANPAQSGIFGLDRTLSLSFYAPRTAWLPYFTSDMSIDATALSIGSRLDRALDLPMPVGLGVTYSRVYFDLGVFDLTSSEGPTIIGQYHPYEKTDNLTIGLGVDYVVKFGAGFTLKWIDSELAPSGSGQETNSASAKVLAHDFGAIAQVPLVDLYGAILDDRPTFGNGVEPFLDLTFGYARRNIGPLVSYGNASQGDPLPRQAVLGWNFEIGLRTDLNGNKLDLMSFMWGREAEDLIVNVTTDSVPSPGGIIYSNSIAYQSGLGDLRPWSNLILGKTFNKIDLQTGWQFQIGECLYIRGGWCNGVENWSYNSRGATFKLNGFLRMLKYIGLLGHEGAMESFLLNHLDIQYSMSNFTSNVNAALNGTQFSSLNFVVR
ncbi:MAG TPA: hypothetical protein VIS48_05335 [Candidatus Kryptonia bacterium]